MPDRAAVDPGDAFEDQFWNLLRRKYAQQDIVRLPATVGGDYGIEGFTRDGIVYQCYADRDSVSLRDRTDKQRSKLNRDTLKLKSNVDKLAAVLDGMLIKHYFLIVPEYNAAELIAHATKRAAVVRSYGLPFIAPDFKIHVKTLHDYPAELAAALMDRAAVVALPPPTVTDASVSLFASERPELVLVLDAKLVALSTLSPGFNVETLRDMLIRSILEKEQLMDHLKDWPETWEMIERRRQSRQQLLEVESELSAGSADERVLGLVRDYGDDLRTNVGGLRDDDAQRIALGQTGEWLMRCPLRFRAVV